MPRQKRALQPDDPAVLDLIGQVSSRKLASIAKAIKTEQTLLDEDLSREALAAAETFVLDSIEETVALPMRDGTSFQWPTANLQKLMRYLIDRAPEFHEFLQYVYAHTPGTPEQPWRMVLSEDELVPGALLRIDNKRKTLCHYLTFMEFPSSARKHVAGWLPLAFLRAEVIKECQGLTSCVEKHLLRNLLLGEQSVVLQGIVLPIGRDKAPVVIFAHLSRSVNDEAAEKAFWSSRGLTSHEPMLHYFVAFPASHPPCSPLRRPYSSPSSP